MRERSLMVNDNPVERRLLDQSVRGFGYEPALALLDERGHVRALADIEAEVIRFAISHYRGQMSEVARRLHIGRSTLYRSHSRRKSRVRKRLRCNPVAVVEKKIGSPVVGG